MEDTTGTAPKSESELLKIIIFSFGFKHGVPVDANMLFDVRFLPNPYWQENLRPMSGRDREVSDYVVGSEQGRRFFELLRPLVNFVGEQSAATKKEFRIGIGCTGGRHRSVTVVEALKQNLEQDQSIELVVFHRDIDKNGH